MGILDMARRLGDPLYDKFQERIQETYDWEERERKAFLDRVSLGGDEEDEDD